MENMEIAWEDFILEEPNTTKAFVQPKTARSGAGSRKQSVESRTSRASGDSNILFSKDAAEAEEIAKTGKVAEERVEELTAEAKTADDLVEVTQDDLVVMGKDDILDTK